jgi:hypothetical protein
VIFQELLRYFRCKSVDCWNNDFIAVDVPAVLRFVKLTLYLVVIKQTVDEVQEAERNEGRLVLQADFKRFADFFLTIFFLLEGFFLAAATAAVSRSSAFCSFFLYFSFSFSS